MMLQVYRIFDKDGWMIFSILPTNLYIISILHCINRTDNQVHPFIRSKERFFFLLPIFLYIYIYQRIMFLYRVFIFFLIYTIALRRSVGRKMGCFSMYDHFFFFWYVLRKMTVSRREYLISIFFFCWIQNSMDWI